MAVMDEDKVWPLVSAVATLTESVDAAIVPMFAYTETENSAQLAAVLRSVADEIDGMPAAEGQAATSGVIRNLAAYIEANDELIERLGL